MSQYLNSPAAQQNSEATAPTAGGVAQRSAKEQSARRKDEAKQATKKPKENALSQFDLNNYASKYTHLHCRHVYWLASKPAASPLS